MLNKYLLFIACLFVSINVVAQGIPPPGLDCCDELLAETNDMDAYMECENSSNPSAYCTAALPIDKSVYMYVSMATGFAFASFVIFKKVKRKKTPI